MSDFREIYKEVEADSMRTTNQNNQWIISILFANRTKIVQSKSPQFTFVIHCHQSDSNEIDEVFNNGDTAVLLYSDAELINQVIQIQNNIMVCKDVQIQCIN